MRKILLAAVSVLLLSARANAVDRKTFESVGMEVTYSSGCETAASSHTVIGQAVSFAVTAYGGNVTYTLKHASGTSSGFNLSVSSPVVVRSGETVSEKFSGLVFNPIFLMDSIATGATAQIEIQYLAPRGAGGNP